MQKRIRWAISAFTAAGLLLTGTAAAASHNTGPAPGHTTTAAHKVDGTATQQAVIFQHKNGVIPASGIVGSQTNRALGNTNSSMIQLVAYTSGSNFGKAYIRKCGIVTCSIYYSHQMTVQLAAQLDGVQTVTDGATFAGLVCQGLALAVGTPVALITGAGCLVVAAAAFAYHLDLEAIDHAATTAGCVRFRTLDGINDVSIPAVYADHSAICHSMDP